MQLFSFLVVDLLSIQFGKAKQGSIFISVHSLNTASRRDHLCPALPEYPSAWASAVGLSQRNWNLLSSPVTLCLCQLATNCVGFQSSPHLCVVSAFFNQWSSPPAIIMAPWGGWGEWQGHYHLKDTQKECRFVTAADDAQALPCPAPSHVCFWRWSFRQLWNFLFEKWAFSREQVFKTGE